MPLVVITKDGLTFEEFQRLGNQFDALYWKEQTYKGIEYSVPFNEETGLYELVPKNSETGEDLDSAPRVIKWADKETAPDGTPYEYSRGNKDIFKDWIPRWLELGFDDRFEEIEKPAEWIEEEEV